MNLPNKLTILRIILVPVFMACFMVNFPFHYFVALAVFALAAFTDFLDGKIARKYNLITNIGKFLDPIADKMLSTVALILFASYGLIPNPYGVICVSLFVSRDLFVSGIRLIAATKNCVIAADKFGKYKTFILDVSIPAIILAFALGEVVSFGTIFTVFVWIGYALMIIASVLNIVSGINYVVKNKILLKD